MNLNPHQVMLIGATFAVTGSVVWWFKRYLNQFWLDFDQINNHDGD